MVKKKVGQNKKTNKLSKVVKIERTKRASYADYLDGKLKLELYQKIGVILLVVVFAGFAGWLWEFSLQEIGGKFQHLYML